jgi:hypothetical protein
MDGQKARVKVLGAFCDYANMPINIKKGEAVSHKCHEYIQEVRGTAPFILTLSTMFIRGKLHAPAALHPRRKAQYPMNSRLGGNQNLPGQILCLCIHIYHGILIWWISWAPLLMKFYINIQHLLIKQLANIMD